jgi:hypothetical protein
MDKLTVAEAGGREQLVVRSVEPSKWTELTRCAALAVLQRWTVTPAMEEMSLFD